MIRATELAGRAVIDIEQAEKIGTIERLILDPEGRRVAGFIVSHGRGFASNKDRTTIPASAVHAIGPDAVTIKHAADESADLAYIDALPRGTDVIGRKVVTEDGRYLGKIDDVLIDRSEGHIFGYTLSDHKGPGKHPYLPADSNVKAGKDLMVASESAMRYEWQQDDKSDHPVEWAKHPLPPASQEATVESEFTSEAGSSRDTQARDGRETNPRVY
jgi:sporulation protein YlmC with PRC-barrel domain